MSEKKRCPKCGEEVEEGAETCPFCGADLTESADEEDWMDMLSDLEDLEGLEEGAESNTEEKESGGIDNRLDDLLDSILVDTDGSRGGETVGTSEDDDMALPDTVIVEANQIEKEMEIPDDFTESSATEESRVSDTEDSTNKEIESPMAEEETPIHEEVFEGDIGPGGDEMPEETMEEEGEEAEETAPDLASEDEDYEEEEEYEELEEEEIEEEEAPKKSKKPKKEKKKGREKPPKREKPKKERTPRQRREGPSPVTPPAILGLGLLTFLGGYYGYYSSSLNSTTAGLIMMVASFIAAAGVSMRYSRA